MAGGALALDNSATGLQQALTSMGKAFVGDAGDEARAAYYGSEVALNRQKAADLRATAMGRTTLADALTRGETGPALYGHLAFDPNYLQLAPTTNLGLTSLAPGMTLSDPRLALAQVGAKEPYTSTYQGTQDQLSNALKQAGIHAGATIQAANIAAGEHRYEWANAPEIVTVPDTRPGAAPGATMEVPVARSKVVGAPPGTYTAPLSAPQASLITHDRTLERVRVPDPNNPGGFIETLAPAGAVRQAKPGDYQAPLASPQVQQQEADQKYREWLMGNTVRVLDTADGQEKLVSRYDMQQNPNRFLAPKTEAQVSADKADTETRTTAQQPFKVDKAATEAIHQTTLDQLDAALGLTRDSHGMGGLLYGADMSKYPGLDIGKIEARASEIYQATGDIVGATRAAIIESQGTSPQPFKSGWFTNQAYKPGASVPGPTVQRDASGQVVRPPAVSTRNRTEARQPAPYEPPKIVPIPEAPPLPVPGAAPGGAGGGAVAQQEIAPEQKVQISRSLENASPADAKASAARMIKAKPQLRTAIIAMLRQHNIDTSGL